MVLCIHDLCNVNAHVYEMLMDTHVNMLVIKNACDSNSNQPFTCFARPNLYECLYECYMKWMS